MCIVQGLQAEVDGGGEGGEGGEGGAGGFRGVGGVGVAVSHFEA